jgi:hypothetical protein
MDEVHFRVDFVVPIQYIEISGVKAEGPRHVEISREEGEQDGDGKTEPEERRLEQVVIITIDWRGKPTGCDNRINGLRK